MKILYDNEIFGLQRFGGISRYFSEIINLLKTYEEVQVDFGLIYTTNYYLSKNKLGNFFPIKKPLKFKGSHKLESFINNNYTKFKLRYSNYDIFHPTYLNITFFKYIKKKPFCLTVHDIIPFLFKNEFNYPDQYYTNFKKLVEKSSQIIAISQRTKMDLLELFKIPESKINIIYHGYNSNIKKLSWREKQILPKKFLLYVGNRSGYKNFKNFIIAFQKVVDFHKDLNLVCAGGGKPNTYELSLIQNLNLENKVFFFPSLNDSELFYLYNKALSFIFPSLYEGFGLPLLEAFSNNCPVIASNTGAIPEIASDAAIYFNPYDIDSIYETITNTIANQALLKKLVSKGRERIKSFSWSIAAKKTFLVYKKILE